MRHTLQLLVARGATDITAVCVVAAPEGIAVLERSGLPVRLVTASIDTGLNAIKNSGTLESTGSGGLEIHSDVLNSGQIWANGGNVKADGAVTGPGSAVISGAATLEFAGLVAEDVQFAQAATGTLRLDSSANFTGTVSNFGAGNQLDLADIGFAAGASMSYAENQQGTGGTLTVSDGSHTANITLLGQYAADGFQGSDDHHAGTLIAYHPPIV